MYINLAYFKSPVVVARLAAVVISIVLMCLTAVVQDRVAYRSYVVNEHTAFMWFALIVSMFTAIFFLIAWYFDWPKQKPPDKKWHLAEMILSLIWVLSCFIAGALAASMSATVEQYVRFGNWRGFGRFQYEKDHYAAASFFFFLDVLVWGIQAFLQFKLWKTN